jgi:lysophospholipase L1-like esterase
MDSSMPAASSPAAAPSSSANVGGNNPNVFAAIGDSITQGFGVSGSYPSRVAGIVGKSAINLGSRSALSSSAAGQARNAVGRQPGFVCIMFGTNDVFREIPGGTVAGNVRAAVSVVQANNSIAIVGTIPPWTRSSFQNGLAASISGQLRGMASSAGARLADVSAEMGSGSGLIQADGYHPNDAGTQVIAFAFADAIRR